MTTCALFCICCVLIYKEVKSSHYFSQKRMWWISISCWRHMDTKLVWIWTWKKDRSQVHYYSFDSLFKNRIFLNICVSATEKPNTDVLVSLRQRGVESDVCLLFLLYPCSRQQMYHVYKNGRQLWRWPFGTKFESVLPRVQPNLSTKSEEIPWRCSAACTRPKSLL